MDENRVSRFFRTLLYLTLSSAYVQASTIKFWNALINYAST